MREEIRICESRGDDPLAEIGNRFSNDADALFVLQRKKEWTEKRAVDAVAKGEFGVAEACEKFLEKSGDFASAGRSNSFQ